MFEHVGQRQHAGLLRQDPPAAEAGRPADEPRHHRRRHAQPSQLGAGMGDFIERYIFPGGELLHVSHVLRDDGRGGPRAGRRREPAAALRRARCGPGRMRSRRGSGEAREVTRESVVRAYRLYLAGSAMSFEQGWIALHQMLAARPTGRVEGGRDARGTIGVSLQPRLHLSRDATMIYKFKSKAAGDVIMMGPTGDAVLRVDRPGAVRRRASSSRRRCRPRCAAIEQADRRRRRGARRGRGQGAGPTASGCRGRRHRAAPARLAAGRDDAGARSRRRAESSGASEFAADEASEQA